MNIHWKQIKLPTEYEVSKAGYIRNTKTGKKLTAYENGNGYKAVKIMVKGVPHEFQVHRLVAMVWIKNPENKPQVNHKDGNKKNNNVSNLEWVTQAENRKHAEENGLMHKNTLKKLPDNVKMNIYRAVKRGKSLGEVAKKHGLTSGQVSSLIKQMERKAPRLASNVIQQTILKEKEDKDPPSNGGSS